MVRRPLLACLIIATLAVGCSSADDGGQDQGGRTTGGKSSVDGSGDSGDTSKSGTSDGSSGTSSTTAAPTTTTAPPKPPELPRGGTQIFPAFRVVATYGNAQSAAMGVLGETPPEEAAAKLEPMAQAFAQPDRPVLPAFELIVTVAQGSPGASGTYSVPTPEDMVQRWLDAARAARVMLILDLQPGTGNFMDDARRFERFLREPDVGLALDPEWRMAAGGVPGQRIGTADAAEINEVSAWLADIVAEEKLPEKLFVVHLFTETMVTNKAALVDRPGLATTLHIDGFGGRQVKLQKYEALKGPFAKGFKLFLDEDTDIYTPADVLAFADPPDIITYQ